MAKIPLETCLWYQAKRGWHLRGTMEFPHDFFLGRFLTWNPLSMFLMMADRLSAVRLYGSQIENLLLNISFQGALFVWQPVLMPSAENLLDRNLVDGRRGRCSMGGPTFCRLFVPDRSGTMRTCNCMHCFMLCGSI